MGNFWLALLVQDFFWQVNDFFSLCSSSYEIFLALFPCIFFFSLKPSHSARVSLHKCRVIVLAAVAVMLNGWRPELSLI